jgi:hypothetical protein
MMAMKTIMGNQGDAFVAFSRREIMHRRMREGGRSLDDVQDARLLITVHDHVR